MGQDRSQTQCQRKRGRDFVYSLDTKNTFICTSRFRDKILIMNHLTLRVVSSKDEPILLKANIFSKSYHVQYVREPIKQLIVVGHLRCIL